MARKFILSYIKLTFSDVRSLYDSGLLNTHDSFICIKMHIKAVSCHFSQKSLLFNCLPLN